VVGGDGEREDVDIAVAVLAVLAILLYCPLSFHTPPYIKMEPL